MNLNFRRYSRLCFYNRGSTKYRNVSSAIIAKISLNILAVIIKLVMKKPISSSIFNIGTNTQFHTESVNSVAINFISNDNDVIFLVI